MIFPSLNKTSFSIAYAQDDGGTIVGKEEKTIVEDGLIVETQESWVTNSDTYFEVTLDEEYVLNSNDYLAIDFKITKHNYDYFICKFGVNGHLFSVGENGSETITSFAAINSGAVSTVTQKFNFFFFFVAEFDGTIFISKDYIGSNNELESTIKTFRVQYDSSNPSRQFNVVWRSIYVVNKEYLSREEGKTLFNFKDLNTNDDKTINDKRFKSSNNLVTSNDSREYTITTIEGVNLISSLDRGMVFGMRSKSDGAVDLSSDEFGDTYKNNALSLLKFDLQDRSFSPRDGFAFNFYAITNCYFKVIIQDENGNLFMSNIPSVGSTTMNYIDSLSVAKTLQCRYEAFYVEAKQSGTVFVPYSSLIDCKYFKGNPVNNTDVLGKITAIYLGIAYSLSPGKRIIFGSFSDVSIKEEKVTTIFDTAKLSEEELNYDDLLASTFAYPDGTSEYHINNLKIEKAYPSLLSTFKNIDLLKGLIERCKSIDKDLYTESSYENLKNILITVELSLENEYLSQSELDTMYEKLSLAFYNLELKEEKNSIVDLIFFIASIVSAIIGISFLAIVVAVLFKRKKYEK
jgi:hypothetical protein